MQKYQDVVLNQNGNPVSGVQVTVTDLLGTPVSVYSANAIGLNVNPLTSDNNGRFSFYAPDGRYSLSFSFGGNVVASITDILLEDPMDGSDAVFNDVTILGELSDASKVTSAPVGGLTATNVQAALAELDGNKIDASSLAAPGGSALVGFKQSSTGAVDRTAQDKLREVVSVKDFGAVGDGVADDSNALESMWQYIKDSAVNYDPTTLDWVTTRYVIPPGKYRVTRSINWTNLLAWNIHVEAKGALIVAEVNGKPAVDMLNTRGVHLDGLSVQTAAGYTPQSAFLVGIGTTGTCGNNRFSAVKTAGSFSIAACHNIGSETTRYDFCYWQNKVGTGYAYAADCNNLLGAVSDYVTLRVPGTPVSFTSNAFYGCRFANYATSGNSVYLEGTAGWFFDKMNYYLAFDNANIIIRQGPSNRTSSLKIAGLFETSQGAGVKDCVKIVLDNGANSAIDGFELDVATPHASRSIVRLETPAGTELTSGEFLIRTAVIKWDAVWTGTPTLFSGEKLSFLGDLYVRPSANINLSKLVKMHGCIYTTDASLVTKGTDGATHAYMMVDTATLAAQGISFGGIGGGFVGIQASSVSQRIRAVSSATNSDLWLSGKGTGRIRFGTRTASADAPVTGYIEIIDDGGTIRRLAVIG